MKLFGEVKMKLLNIVKEIFVPEKDYANRRIDDVISRLSLQTQTNFYDWSYIREESVYENTRNGMRVYPHEVSRVAA
jgi:hypothetical protein